MGACGEYSPAGGAPARPGPCLSRNLPLELVAPRWLGSRTDNLPRTPEGQGGWGSFHVPAGFRESPGKVKSDLDTESRFGGSGRRGAATCVRRKLIPGSWSNHRDLREGKPLSHRD